MENHQDKSILGIIGGSGVYEIEGLTGQRWGKVDSPFGGPSDYLPIEERAPEEVTGFRDCQWAAQEVRVRNPAFDVTPSELVTGLITEKGVFCSLMRKS